MNDTIADSHINYFRSRVTVKGDNSSAKAKYVLDRWKKVLEDCQKSNDHSAYRKDFASSHKEPITLLSALLEKNLEDKEISKHVKMLKYKFLSHLKSFTNTSAVTDALCYIILELELIEDIPNV